MNSISALFSHDPDATIIRPKPVRLPKQSREQTEKSLSDNPKTTFIVAADLFLDLFCQSKKTEDENKAAATPDGGVKTRRGARRLVILGGSRAFFSELRSALAEEKPHHSKLSWLLAGSLVLLILVVGLGAYLMGAPERKIKMLLADGRYEEGASLASQYLAKHPNDERLVALAAEALVKHLTPAWMAQLEKGDFAAAKALLNEAGELGRFDGDARETLELLGWMGELEQFLAERGGPESPIVIFKHEQPINALLDWWRADEYGHRRQLIEILRDVPAFETRYARAFSQLRLLENEKSIYLKAIAKLKTTIQEALAADRAGELSEAFYDFADKYPKVRGMERLWADLNAWRSLETAIRERDLPEALRLSSGIVFSTPPFQEQAKDRISAALPPEEVVAGYRKAADAWSAGDWERAIDELEPLTQAAWGDLAARRLARYRTLSGDFQALLAARNAADYGVRLLRFYAALNPAEDVFFVQSLEADARRHQRLALDEAGKLLKAAEQVWTDYQADGGIGSLLRLETTVSPFFERQARLLTQAYADSSRGVRLYDLLRLDPPPAAEALRSEILAEAKRQRRWLGDMSLVLEPALLKAKLQLLPEAGERAHESES